MLNTIDNLRQFARQHGHMVSLSSDRSSVTLWVAYTVDGKHAGFEFHAGIRTMRDMRAALGY